MGVLIQRAASPLRRKLSRRWFAGLLLLVSCGCDVPAVDRPLIEPAATAAAPPAPLEVQQRIDEVLAWTYHHRRLNLQDHAAWQILHGVLAYKHDFLIDDGPRRVPAIQHLLTGGTMKGWMIEPGDVDPTTGRRGLRALLDLGSTTGQGHPDQWLAILAQCGFAPDEKIRVGDHEYLATDWIRQAELDVARNPNGEYAWTIISLTAYHPTSYSWQAADKRTWNIERLIELETEADLSRAACGGTHSLSGLAIAINHHLSDGGQLTGVWKKADEKVQHAIATVREYQNPSGSLSSNYFTRPGSTKDLGTDMSASGHQLEFLTLSMSDKQLAEPWVERAVLHLCDLFRKTKQVDMECGALYHAANALSIYRARRFGAVNYAEAKKEFPNPNDQ